MRRVLVVEQDAGQAARVVDDGRCADHAAIAARNLNDPTRGTRPDCARRHRSRADAAALDPTPGHHDHRGRTAGHHHPADVHPQPDLLAACEQSLHHAGDLLDPATGQETERMATLHQLAEYVEVGLGRGGLGQQHVRHQLH